MSLSRLRKLGPSFRLACSVLVLGACTRHEPPVPVDPLEVQLATMDAHELAAVTLAAAVRLRGDDIDPAFLAEIATGAAGAVFVRGDDPDAPARVTKLRAAAPGPLLVILDLDARALPPARLLAAVAEPGLLRRAGEEAALRARPFGAAIGLLSLPPLNGSKPLPAAARDPERIVTALAEFAAGAEAEGLAIGLQALWTDGDEAPLRWDLARLEAVELRELRALVETPVAAVALGSARLPALTGDSLPLPLSPAGPRGLVRRDLAYDGLVMADLSPGSALARDAGPVDGAIAALEAGVDLLLGVEQPALVVDGVAAAVAAGRLRPERLRDAARRVLRLQWRLTGADSARAAAGAGAAQRSRAAELAFDTLPAVRAANRIAAATSPAQADSLVLALGEKGAPPEDATPRGQWPPAPRLQEASATSVGMRATLGAGVDALMRKALADSVFSAAAVAVGRRGGLVLLRGYGREGRGGGGDPVDPSTTIFDLASLTKVLGTTTAVALLIDEGRMELDAPLERYLPRFDGKWKDDVLIRHLLTHSSGLPSGLWLFGSAGSREEALSQVLRQDLLRKPGERMEYSDLGMILLAEAAEVAAGMPLDRYLALRLFAPLGMESTMYLPPVALRAGIVPTAEKTEREFALHGVVHDANAFRLGGIAGHAGLFSTAADVAVFAQMMLNGGAYGSARILSSGTVRAFTTRQPGAEQRALGWDTPSRLSSAGRYFSSRSFGHTGYTGTSLWVDPAADLFVVLLTNRTYVGASGGEILRLRAAVHDAAARAITDRTISRRPGAR